ncbi:MAG: (2Fe-2S) ferredoxin domain-containing protein, partial [Eubacteriales bacterium]|nr:(2Fe-2S) ferredoxin domain-containing protein [Eubacteriales bacterium]
MKSLQELAEIRKRAQDNVSLRKENNGKRIVVGMATCGIAA